MCILEKNFTNKMKNSKNNMKILKNYAKLNKEVIILI